MAVSFTKEQLDVINVRGGNVLVSASAGSGKTTVMIERILSLLFDRSVPDGNPLLHRRASLDRMVICTFTVSAAADMKDKLQSALIAAAESGEDYARAQLELLPGAAIGTLHSWFLRLVRKYFYVTDTDPAFELADETEAGVMLREALDALINERLDGGDETFLAFYDAMMRRRSDGDLKDLLKRIYDYARAQTDPEAWMRGGALAGEKDPAAATAEVERARRRVAARYARLAEDLADRTAAAGFKRNMPATREFAEFLRGEGTAAEGSVPRGRIPEGMESLADEFKALKKAYQKAMEPFAAFDNLPAPDGAFSSLILDLVLDLDGRYAAIKRARARLDYGDLEHYACVLLADERSRGEILASAEYLFVDEYQDINPLQERIISAFTESSLFLVGDVKQSIYEFRMCDPEIFLDKCERARERGFLPPHSLNRNFRSAEKILSAVNGLFDRLMTEEFGKVNYRDRARLIAGGDRGEGEVICRAVVSAPPAHAAPGVYSVMENADSERESGAEAEADLVAADIAEKLKSGRVFAGRDDGGAEILRPVRPGDIAVLSAVREPLLSAIYNRLRRMGVNAALSDDVEFMSVHEVALLVEFLRYLVDNTDAIALTALLLCPIGGLDEGSLAAVRAAGAAGERRFDRVCRAYAESHDDDIAKKLNEFYALTRRYLDYSYTHSAGEVLGALTGEKDWFAYALSGAAPDLAADAITAFLAYANASPFGGSVREFVASLEAKPTMQHKASSDAVTLSTVHASKGLEYPFVYLVGTEKAFKFDESKQKAVLDRTLGLCMRNFDLAARTVNPNTLTAAAVIKRRRTNAEERMRLLYVAMTRAKQGLYIYAAVKQSDPLVTGDEKRYEPEEGNSFFDWLRPMFAGCELVPAADAHIDFTEDERKIYPAADEEQAARLAEYFTDPPRTHSAIKSSVTKMMEEAEEEEPVVYRAGENDDRAAEKGTAYHKAMELIDFDAPFAAEWDRLAAIMGDKLGLVDKEELCRAHAMMGKALSGREYFREQGFIYNMDGTLVQGVVDLIAERGENLEIIDYKTSKESTILSGEYDLQLSIYARAAEEILGKKVTRRAVYSFRTGKFYDSPIKK